MIGLSHITVTIWKVR